MVFFEGNAFLEDSYVTNTRLTNCTIGTSVLDMNYKNITSVADPNLDYDAVNKRYVDALDISYSNLSLNGTVASVIPDAPNGVYIAKVYGTLYGSPCAVFNITGSCVNRLNSTAGTGSRNTLRLIYENGILKLRKTESSYDGNYILKFI